MRSFARDRLVFEVKDEGPEDGTAVVFLHGFPQDATCWDGVVDPLHEHGYRTLAPNQRGYSPDARPTAAKQYSWAATAADVIGLLDAAEVEKAHIVGHDWGGSVAWCVASQYPDRVLTVTSLSTPHPGALRKSAVRSTQLLNSWYMGLFQVPVVSEQLLNPGGPIWQALVRGLPRHQAQHYAQRLQQPGALSAALNWYRALPRELIRPSLKVHRITVPAMYLWGEKDPALGRSAAVMTAEFMNDDYRFTILKGVGHWIPETVPDLVVAALLDFWSQEDR